MPLLISFYTRFRLVSHQFDSNIINTYRNACWFDCPCRGRPKVKLNQMCNEVGLRKSLHFRVGRRRRATQLLHFAKKAITWALSETNLVAASGIFENIVWAVRQLNWNNEFITLTTAISLEKFFNSELGRGEKGVIHRSKAMKWRCAVWLKAASYQNHLQQHLSDGFSIVLCWLFTDANISFCICCRSPNCPSATSADLPEEVIHFCRLDKAGIVVGKILLLRVLMTSRKHLFFFSGTCTPWQRFSRAEGAWYHNYKTRHTSSHAFMSANFSSADQARLYMSLV